MAADAKQPVNRAEPHFLSWLFTNRITLGLAAVVALLTVFYVEEDVRGKLAWQRFRRQLKANDQMLDWNSFVPPPVPEAENVFRAPKMKDWFVFGGLNDFGPRKGMYYLSKYLKERGSGRIGEIIVVPIDTNAFSRAADADMVLRYVPSFISLAPDERNERPHEELKRDLIPLIIMEDVPLADAIGNFAAQADIKYAFGPDVAKDYASNGRPQPTVTLHWEKITAGHALISLLNNYGLQLIENPKTGIALIRAADPVHPKVYVDTDASEELKKLIRRTITTNEVPFINGAQGIKLLADVPPIKPFHIFIQANQIPSPAEMKQLLPGEILRGLPSAGNQMTVDYTGSNTFTVSFASDRVTAAQYLDWNNRFLRDFYLIREGLKRPFARMDGDYSQPFSQPRLDFVNIRVISQTIAQRAQSYLLLGEPDSALRELTLLHEMNRLLEPRPVTLAAAMIETAITGVYLNVIEDGFRLHAWREPQLSTLQSQLEEINLPGQLHSAFLAERAGICRLLDGQNAANIQSLGRTSQTIWQRLQDPKLLLLSFAPRGWNHQNMVLCAEFTGRCLDSFDPNQQIFLPKRLETCIRDVQSNFSRLNPQNFLAAMWVPNFNQACKTLARTQTLVNEAILACALERFHLAHDNYPEKLDLLVPRYIQKLPSDLIGGQSLHYRRQPQNHFLLYSVGWNELDDGGISVHKKDGSIAIEQGDWVWKPDEIQR